MDYTIVCCDDTGYNKKLFQCLLHDLSEDSKTKVIYKNICMPTLLKKIIFWRMPNRVDSRFLRYEIDKIIKSKKDKYQGINLILFNIATRYYDANKIELLKSMYPMLKIYLWIIDPIDMAASMSNTLHLIDNHYELLDGIWINDDSENVLKRTKAKFQYSPYSIISKYSNLFDSAKYDVYWGGCSKRENFTIKRLGQCF